MVVVVVVGGCVVVGVWVDVVVEAVVGVSVLVTGITVMGGLCCPVDEAQLAHDASQALSQTVCNKIREIILTAQLALEASRLQEDMQLDWQREMHRKGAGAGG